jgi:hypothetical protein
VSLATGRWQQEPIDEVEAAKRSGTALSPSRVRASSVGQRARVEELRRAPWVRERGVQLGGLEWAEAGDDDFNALMQAAALVRMVDSGTPL